MRKIAMTTKCVVFLFLVFVTVNVYSFRCLKNKKEKWRILKPEDKNKLSKRSDDDGK